MGYIIHCDANYDYGHYTDEWRFNVIWNDGDVSETYRFCNTGEMIDYVCDIMDKYDEIVRIHIYDGLLWWGEIER